jgi:hypothetical protein
MSRRLLFLPGAGADPAFGRPIGDRLPETWEKVYLGWPSIGYAPSEEGSRFLRENRTASVSTGRAIPLPQRPGPCTNEPAAHATLPSVATQRQTPTKEQ